MENCYKRKFETFIGRLIIIYCKKFKLVKNFLNLIYPEMLIYKIY